MAYIYLDESGDLGFRETSSKWFLFTIAITNDSRVLERIMKKIWRPLKKKHKKLGELHASQEKDSTRRRLLQRLSEVNYLKVLCVILNKKKVYVDLQNQKNYLYNYTANILLDRLCQVPNLLIIECKRLFSCFLRKLTGVVFNVVCIRLLIVKTPESG